MMQRRGRNWIRGGLKMGRRARPLGVSAICETVGNKRKLAVMSKLVSNIAAEPERFS